MGMRNVVVCVAMVFVAIGCPKPPKQVAEVKRFPLDNLEGIITQSGVEIDRKISSDGNGSL